MYVRPKEKEWGNAILDDLPSLVDDGQAIIVKDPFIYLYVFLGLSINGRIT